jgi:two-component system sensor histidine kinase KdpD
MPPVDQQARGRLKVFLGYAAGVGKTFQMLTEAHALKDQGRDVVIGYFEPHARKDTIALTEGLEIVARRVIDYKGSRLEEMDTGAILRRRPDIAVVDEFAHTNVPGSERTKRWEDVLVLLEAGIHVFTTMNVQHLESLNDQIWQSTGVRVRETVPDWVIKQADEVVMVDLTPRALLHRLERGVVYPPDRAIRALQGFFKEPTLVALRELAMRQTAYSVESRQPQEEVPSERGAADSRERPDKLLLVIKPEPRSAALIRRGRRVADYLRAECLAVCVSTTGNLDDLPVDTRDELDRLLNFARALLIETRVLRGDDAAKTIVNFARLHGVTQIFVARERPHPIRAWLGAAEVQRIVSLAGDMQVTVVADRSTRREAQR